MTKRSEPSFHPAYRSLVLVASGLVLLLLAACMPAGLVPSGEEEVPPIVGTVTFPRYQVQATISEVASASTVTLIDATTNVSQGATVTDASGSFSLTFSNRFRPITNRTYYLEAMKGLSNNLAGRDAARVRTVLQFNAGWRSLTSSIVNSPIYINEGTTTLSVIASHKGATRVPPDSLIGKLTVNPEVFTPVTNVSSTEFTDVRSLVANLLLGNGDPIAGVGYDLGPPERFFAMLSGSTILTVAPTSANVNQQIILSGLTFDTTLTNNVVTFNPGVTGTVTGISPDRQSLYVLVPSSATTGAVTVRLNGQLYGIPSLTILGTLNAGLY